MDFESVADELYALDRDEFTAARDRRAAESRKAGDKDLATRIKGLRKPTNAAWLVNQLARRRPEDIAELAELGDALRRAHSELAGEDLRALSRRRHELVQALADRAAKLGGGKVGESVVREVHDTLDAALTDPALARAVTEGRLTSALRPGDAFAGDWMALGPAPARPERRAEPTKSEPKHAEPKRAERTESTKAEPRKPAPKRAAPKPEPREKKQPEPEEPPSDDEARRLREERQRARDALSKARAARNDAARELRLAEAAEAKARKRTMAARKEFEAADERVDEAEAVLSELL